MYIFIYNSCYDDLNGDGECIVYIYGVLMFIKNWLIVNIVRKIYCNVFFVYSVCMYLSN